VRVTAAEADGVVEHGLAGRNLDGGTEGTALAGLGRGRREPAGVYQIAPPLLRG
jgi:hypothetical protein